MHKRITVVGVCLSVCLPSRDKLQILRSLEPTSYSAYGFYTSDMQDMVWGEPERGSAQNVMEI